MDNRSWNLNAPQWADFNASLQSDVDEYFNTEQDLEARYASGADSPNSRNSSYSTPRSNGFASPMFPRNTNSRLNKTTDNLSGAMTHLQIKSAKKTPLRRSVLPSAATSAKKMTVDSLVTDAVIQNEKTAEDARATKPDAQEYNADDNRVENPIQSSAAEMSSEVLNPEENGDINTTLVASPEDEESSSIGPLPLPEILAPVARVEAPVAAPKVVAPSSSAVAELPKSPKDAESKLLSLQNRLDPPKRVISEKRIMRGQPVKPTVVATRARRQSVGKYSRPSSKFVSLAEKLHRFHNGTPERYRSAKHKDNIAGPVQKAKQTTMKLTTAMSPVLCCKYRSRPISVPDAQLPTRPKSVSTLACSSNKLETKSKSFPRSKSCNPANKATEKPKTERKVEKIRPSAQMMPPPKAPSVPKQATKMLGEILNAKDASTMSSSMMSESMRKFTPSKKTVASVVSTETGTAIKDVEILHFGIPVGVDYKKTTRPIPFSFEARSKELNKSRKEKLESQKMEEGKTTKPLFVARPVPANSAARTKTVLKAKENIANKPRLMSFQERNELAMKKKREAMEKIAEQEKQARVFHAKPAPTFKPVFVRGNSAENLRLGDGNKKRGISPAARLKGMSQESVASGNQENRAPNPPSNQQCPKLKNPLMAQNVKIKKIPK